MHKADHVHFFEYMSVRPRRVICRTALCVITDKHRQTVLLAALDHYRVFFPALR